MLIRLISLVILFNSFYFYGLSYGQESSFVYPKKKPSIFKKVVSDKKIILPVLKPPEAKKIKKDIKVFTLPVKKPYLGSNDEKKVIKKEVSSKEKKGILQVKINNKDFVFPKKKPATFKATQKSVSHNADTEFSKPSTLDPPIKSPEDITSSIIGRRNSLSAFHCIGRFIYGTFTFIRNSICKNRIQSE